MSQIVPLSTKNQTLEVSLNIDDSVITLALDIRFNRTANYWALKITNPITGEILLDSIPLLTGSIGAANILGQYRYLKIGSLYLIKTGNVSDDYPTEENLGTDFLLLWGDTPDEY
jgi:hypothetical protein